MATMANQFLLFRLAFEKSARGGERVIWKPNLLVVMPADPNLELLILIKFGGETALLDFS
jgi:hypothetical protein